jgi:hypothetical protein
VYHSERWLSRPGGYGFCLVLAVTATGEGGQGDKIKYFGNESRLARRDSFFELC